jgi:hypothetical protein
VIDGGSKTNCFALVGSSGFFPFQCSSRGEVDEWTNAINTNMTRLKLLNQIARLTIQKK